MEQQFTFWPSEFELVQRQFVLVQNRIRKKFFVVMQRRKVFLIRKGENMNAIEFYFKWRDFIPPTERVLFKDNIFEVEDKSYNAGRDSVMPAWEKEHDS